jgi:hypothetical protein
MGKMDNKLIEIAKEQCEIFPEDSYMGEYLRETLKMLQAEPCEDAVSRAELLKIYEDGFDELQKIKHSKYNKGANDRQLGVNWCINTLKDMPPVEQDVCIAKVNFSKEDMQEIVDKKVKEIFKVIPLERLKDFRNKVVDMNSIAIIQRLDKLIEEVEDAKAGDHERTI